VAEPNDEKPKARVLFVGDVHIGRRSGRLPADLTDYDVAPAELTPGAAFRAMVDHAIEERVDAVVMAGDVVERDNCRFEAFGRLQQGVSRLLAAGIPVLAVAGNHDQEALPRLADLIEDFRLVGRNGRWEQVPILRDGAPAAHLVGWSFPSAVVRSSPFAAGSPPPVAGDGLPTLGVMHCDLDGGSGSGYAPVARRDLQRLDYAGWFLGHIHQPSDLSAGPHVGYLGSLSGLDPTETGRRGPWLVEIEGGGGISARQVALAPLRWERTEIGIEGLASDGDLLELVKRAVDELHRRIAPELGKTRVVGCRITLTGRTEYHHEVERQLDSERIDELRLPVEGVLYFVDRVINRSRPALDLAQIARGDDPPALLARDLLALERGDRESMELVRGAMKEMEREAHKRHWSRLKSAEIDEERVRGLLVDSGLTALRELLRQTGVSGEPGEEA
jgi:DNA repair exonuclease SbcCD nuclease subunit